MEELQQKEQQQQLHTGMPVAEDGVSGHVLKDVSGCSFLCADDVKHLLRQNKFKACKQDCEANPNESRNWELLWLGYW